MSDIKEESFNYIDFLSSSATRAYQSQLLDTAIETQGRLCYIFKLDKVATELDPLYNHEKRSRVYLPHYTQRALYKTNTWIGELNLNIYEEPEQNLEFDFNFDRMVHTIRALKDKISGTLSISNFRRTNIILEINEDSFFIKVDNSILVRTGFKNKTIKTMIAELNMINGLKVEYTGNDEPFESIKKKLPLVIYKGKTKKIDVEDATYHNVKEVVELGDLILTDRYKLYEVKQANPSNDSYGSYLSWLCKGNIVDLSIVDGLPSGFRDIIEKNRYSLPKVEQE